MVESAANTVVTSLMAQGGTGGSVGASGGDSGPRGTSQVSNLSLAPNSVPQQ